MPRRAPPRAVTLTRSRASQSSTPSRGTTSATAGELTSTNQRPSGRLRTRNASSRIRVPSESIASHTSSPAGQTDAVERRPRASALSTADRLKPVSRASSLRDIPSSCAAKHALSLATSAAPSTSRARATATARSRTRLIETLSPDSSALMPAHGRGTHRHKGFQRRWLAAALNADQSIRYRQQPTKIHESAGYPRRNPLARRTRRPTAARTAASVPTIRTCVRARVMAVYNNSRVRSDDSSPGRITETTSYWLPWLR